MRWWSLFEKVGGALMAAALAFAGVAAQQTSGSRADFVDNGWARTAIVVGVVGVVVYLMAALAQALSNEPSPAINVFVAPTPATSDPAPAQPAASPSELHASTVSGRTFRLWDAVSPGQKIIFGRVFEDCHITGPMIAYATGCTFDETTFKNANADPNSALWTPPSDAPAGVLWLQQCVFRRGILEDIGFTGPPEVLDHWREHFATMTVRYTDGEPESPS